VSAADWSPVVTGLAFAEGPRWHDGALFVSDIFGCRIWRAVPGHPAEVVHEVPGRPSGTGWLPDGRMVVVSMRDRRLLVEDGPGLRELADLSALVGGDCNDMVVDAQGRCYVGNLGYDVVAGAEPRSTCVVLVGEDQPPRVVADGLWVPNGMAVTPDHSTLLVAETRGGQITAFRIGDDGSLDGRRTFARFAAAGPDGICLDAAGALWVASPATGEVLRVRDGGEVETTLDAPQGRAQACMLGGADGRSLFVCSTPTHDQDEALRRRPGRVDMVTVDVPRAGLP
jgi:sugar lactone lactonase YvrE